MYVSCRDDVYPKYSVMDPRDETLSGSREQSVHWWAEFGMFGKILQGIIGIIIDVIKTAAEAIPE